MKIDFLNIFVKKVYGNKIFSDAVLRNLERNFLSVLCGYIFPSIFKIMSNKLDNDPKRLMIGDTGDLKIDVYGKWLASDTLLTIKTKSLTVKS